MATGACGELADVTDGMKNGARDYAGHVVSLGAFAVGLLIVYALGLLTGFVLGWQGRRATESQARVSPAIVNPTAPDTRPQEPPLSPSTSDSAWKPTADAA